MAHIHIQCSLRYLERYAEIKSRRTNRRTEAALDLGASPLHAFWKVIFPTSCQALFRAFCSPLRCPSMISLSPTSPRDRALIRSTKIYARSPQGNQAGDVLALHDSFCHRTASAAPRMKSLLRRKKREAKEREAMAKKGIRFRITGNGWSSAGFFRSHGACHRRRRYLLRKPECFSGRLPSSLISTTGANIWILMSSISLRKKPVSTLFKEGSMRRTKSCIRKIKPVRFPTILSARPTI